MRPWARAGFKNFGYQLKWLFCYAKREFRANVIHTGDVAQMKWAYDAVTAIRGGLWSVVGRKCTAR